MSCPKNIRFHVELGREKIKGRIASGLRIIDLSR